METTSERLVRYEILLDAAAIRVEDVLGVDLTRRELYYVARHLIHGDTVESIVATIEYERKA